VATTSRLIKLSLYLVTLVAGMGVCANAQQRPVVRVDSGELQGVSDGGVVSYKGIPFAASPVGDLRWRPPQPVMRWTRVRQAAEFGADCMKGRFGPPPGAAATGAPNGPLSSVATPAPSAPHRLRHPRSGKRADF